ncbi:MAG: hypothetical protein N2558_00125 [Patescibacteria group bacterium]|nr:hypothetical protein [Patescibacteria group bacterium]
MRFNQVPKIKINQYQTLENKFYSRKQIIEQKHNLRKAIFLFITSISIILFLIFFGIPTITNLLSIITDMKQSYTSPEKSDATPPIVPEFEPINKYTNKKEIEIKGRTEPGAYVSLSLNGQTSEVLANAEGIFRISLKLVPGENSLYAFSKDTSGNKSNNSENIIIVYDNTPPDIEITKPSDNSSFFGLKERQLTINGKTEPKAKVTINNRYVFVEEDGSFSYTVSLNEGENKFVAKTEDQSGNSSEKEFIVNFVP